MPAMDLIAERSDSYLAAIQVGTGPASAPVPEDVEVTYAATAKPAAAAADDGEEPPKGLCSRKGSKAAKNDAAEQKRQELMSEMVMVRSGVFAATRAWFFPPSRRLSVSLSLFLLRCHPR